MAGPVVVDRERAQVRQFSHRTGEDTQVLLGVMSMIHQEPLSSAYAKLLNGKVPDAEATVLAHFFEEVSVLTMHGHVAEDLLYDMFAIDLYWQQMQAQVKAIRDHSGNQKFGENFEATARAAADYRKALPAKH